MSRNDIDSATTSLLMSIARREVEHGNKAEYRGDKASRSWLAAMVEGLNKMIKEGFDQMITDSNNVSKKDPRTLTDFQVSSQVFSLLMYTAQTVVKTVGEANANAARKQ